MQGQLRPWVIPSLVGVGSFSLGMLGGWFLRGRSKLDAKKLAIAYDVHTNSMMRIDELERALRDRETHIEALTIKEGQRERIDYTAIPPSEEAISVSHVEEVSSNVFDQANDNWDWEEEVEQRTKDAPYVIHRDEYMHEETSYRQSTLTWYAGDKVLCDEMDVPVFNPEKVVGHLTFGHGSGDPNIVYIRNDQLQAEYEILREPGHFAVEVLGAQMEEEADAAELKHSLRPGKFRLD